MKQRELSLSVTPGAWHLFRIRRQDKRFFPLRDKILARDKNTCQFCDFQATQHMEIINCDKNYRNNKPSNLLTACPFCAQCFFIDAIGSSDFGGGNIVYLPELTQAELNSFCHVLFQAMSNETDHAKTAQALYRVYKLRTSVVEEKLGEGSSNPSALGQLLLELGQDDEKVQKKVLSDLRLLPARSRFESEIREWARTQANNPIVE
jgi:intracellular multiplication protein IcmJ